MEDLSEPMMNALKALLISTAYGFSAEKGVMILNELFRMLKACLEACPESNVKEVKERMIIVQDLEKQVSKTDMTPGKTFGEKFTEFDIRKAAMFNSIYMGLINVAAGISSMLVPPPWTSVVFGFRNVAISQIYVAMSAHLSTQVEKCCKTMSQKWCGIKGDMTELYEDIQEEFELLAKDGLGFQPPSETQPDGSITGSDITVNLSVNGRCSTPSQAGSNTGESENASQRIIGG